MNRMLIATLSFLFLLRAAVPAADVTPAAVRAELERLEDLRIVHRFAVQRMQVR